MLHCACRGTRSAASKVCSDSHTLILVHLSKSFWINKLQLAVVAAPPWLLAYTIVCAVEVKSWVCDRSGARGGHPCFGTSTDENPYVKSTKHVEISFQHAAAWKEPLAPGRVALRCHTNRMFRSPIERRRLTAQCGRLLGSGASRRGGFAVSATKVSARAGGADCSNGRLHFSRLTTLIGARPLAYPCNRGDYGGWLASTLSPSCRTLASTKVRATLVRISLFCLMRDRRGFQSRSISEMWVFLWVIVRGSGWGWPN